MVLHVYKPQLILICIDITCHTVYQFKSAKHFIFQEPFTVKTSGEKPIEVTDISPLAKMAISTLLGRLTILQNCVDLDGDDSKQGEAGNTAEGTSKVGFDSH